MLNKKNLNNVCKIWSKENYSIVPFEEIGKIYKGILIDNRGEGNVVEIGNNLKVLGTLKISFHGNNNFVKIGNNVSINKTAYITFYKGGINFLPNECRCEIGNGCVFNGDRISLEFGEEKTNIIIGDRCLFASDIILSTTDNHSIYDLKTNKRTNIAGDICVGEHVWICKEVRILNNSVVKKDSVIGTRALVNKKFAESNVVIGGIPAKIVKRNIKWEADNKILSNDQKKKKQYVAIIPARYQSSRFPGKPLAQILGKPMIQWVYEKVASVQEIEDVYVATDDERIYKEVQKFGGKAIMTGECSCGSDRVYQACKDIDAEIIVNIQGDEPAIKVDMIRDLIRAFDDSRVDMATLKSEIEGEDVANPNIVKVITDKNNDAIYFSRSVIPYNRDKVQGIKYYKHIGVYGYKKQFLEKYVKMSQSELEKTESLEQLRVLENGYKIRVLETRHQSIGVDLPEHIYLVEEELKKEE